MISTFNCSVLTIVKLDKTKKDAKDNSIKNGNSQYDELGLSDDDDFPDEEEILKVTGLKNLKQSSTATVGLTSVTYF